MGTDNYLVSSRLDQYRAQIRGRDAQMNEELMDLLIGECIVRATYQRMVRIDKPAVYLRNVGFCQPFVKYLSLLRDRGQTGRTPPCRPRFAD